MSKILGKTQLPEIAQNLHSQKKSIVLTGGVFDILHQGHIKFLAEAKRAGDFLFVLLESDENIKNKKGPDRPINSQKHRSIVLSGIKVVDYIVILEGVTTDHEYDKLIVQIKPSVIALTKGDTSIKRRAEQAKMIGAKLIAIGKVESPSTSDLVNHI